MERTRLVRNIMLLILAVLAAATAVIFIKASTEHPVLLASYRLIIASVLLSPVFFRHAARYRDRFRYRDIRHCVIPALLLMLHFISWNFGARKTLAANASLIVNMIPVVMPLFVYFFFREVITVREIIGTVLAGAGVVLLARADFHISADTLLGDVTCFVSMLMLAWYMAYGRRNRWFPSLWLYLVPLYAMAGVMAFIVGIFITDPVAGFRLSNLKYAVGLALIPTIIGHSLLNYAMQIFRGQVVAIATLSQFVFAGIMAFFLLGEVPQGVFYTASLLVIAGAGLVIAVRKKPVPIRP